MRTQIRLILSALALTALIWIIADRAGHETSTITVPVRITPADPGSPWVLHLADAGQDEPDVIRVEITFRGPKSGIRRLENDYSFGGFGLTLKIAEGLASGRRARNIFADLTRLPEIQERGLTVQSVLPETVTFDVDRYTTVPIEVEPIAGSYENDLDGKPIIKPDQVVARVLESKLDETFSLSPLPLFLQEAIGKELDKQPEQTEGPRTLTFEVRLHSSRPGIDATFEPDHVEVTVQLKGASKVMRITVRPLGRMIKTQEFFDNYRIEWEDATGAQFTQTINVHVPISKLDRLKELESNTDAYVIIDDSDLPQEPTGPSTTTNAATAESETYRSKLVFFNFPPGFEDVQLAGPQPTVKLRVRRKTYTSSLTPP